MRNFLMYLLAVTAAGVAAPAWAQTADAKPAAKAEMKLPMCPIMDETVDFSTKLATDDGPVFFCCPECMEKYKTDPAKYADKVAAQRAALSKMDRVQVACPMSGDAVDPTTATEIGGQKVAFCCERCREKYASEPAKYKGKLENSYTYQTKCPVSDRGISPTAFADLATGQRVYFCCKGCPERFKADPAKFADALKKQGVHVDVKKLTPQAKDKP